jgi:hypothetical protein
MKFSRIIILFILLVACSPQVTSSPTISTNTPSRPIPTPRYETPAATSSQVKEEATETQSIESSVEPSQTEIGTEESSSNTPTETAIVNDWMNLPILPEPTDRVRAIYEYGQTLGNNPNSFSIFGDCQARPDEFFGLFETDERLVASLTPDLQETVDHFYGSFNRESPTAQDGTTPGALLWDQWHRGEYGCTFAETPVDCELRVHNPSFVIIQIGSHFESRNTEYLRRIITQLIDRGVVPILATKADNRELDHRVNRDMALLAEEFDLPLWNFWASLSDLPNRGLYTRDDRPLQGPIYLNEDAREIHRMTGLEALDIVWRYAIDN